WRGTPSLTAAPWRQVCNLPGRNNRASYKLDPQLSRTGAMQKLVGIALALIAAVLVSQVGAQPPGGRPAGPGKDTSKDNSNSPLVTKMMAFDKNKDGKLTRDEVTDERLLRLFDQADTNKDGVVTREELMALAEKLEADSGPGGDRGGPGGPGGPGG